MEWLEKHNPELLKYDSGVVELRDRELFDVILGNGAKYDHYKDRKFPPPRPRAAPPVPDDFNFLSDSAGPPL